jgi:hypothetical protein
MDMLKLIVFGTALLAPGLAGAQDIAPIALNSLSATPEGIESARVLDERGNYIGDVRQVTTDQDGKPSAISIMSKSGRLTVVSASAASYDEPRNIVVASIQDQLIVAK